jgi:glyoxylase-like metal-dependent hydrolase (beta-lactamase superfamily II)
MEALWGGIDPIDADRIRALEDGDKIDLGGRILQAIDTPGHAGHHHAYLDDDTGLMFCGDALGVRLPDTGAVRPATPPPEFDLERAIASIERIRSIAPTALWPTHFGRFPASVDAACEEAIEALRSWSRWVEEARATTDDIDVATELVKKRARAALEGRLAPDEIRRLEQTTSYRMNVSGYMRYFDRT